MTPPWWWLKSTSLYARMSSLLKWRGGHEINTTCPDEVEIEVALADFRNSVCWQGLPKIVTDFGIKWSCKQKKFGDWELDQWSNNLDLNIALLGRIFADEIAPNPLASDGSSDRLQGDRLQGDRLQGDKLQGDRLQVSSSDLNDDFSTFAYDWNQILLFRFTTRFH